MPVYFLEVQFYSLPSIYASLMAKVYTYLKQHDPAQAFVGVVLFASRNLEPKGLAPYRALLDAGLIRPFYLEEMSGIGESSTWPIDHVLNSANGEPGSGDGPQSRRAARAEIGDEALRIDLIELIETVIMYKLTRLNREEIQTMLQIHDIRERGLGRKRNRKAWRKGMEKGKEMGKEMGIEMGMEKGVAIAKLAAEKKSAAEIAAILGVNVETVHRVLAKVDRN